jgi:hypothetical protein
MFSFANSIVINRLKTPTSWNVCDGLEQEPSHYPYYKECGIQKENAMKKALNKV